MNTDNHPCFVTPHPNVKALLWDIVFPQTPGLNDGAIFPPSHFPPGTAAEVISNSGLNYDPLWGVIQVAIVLIDFNDTVMNGPEVMQHFRELFFSTGSGSVSNYYAEINRNKTSKFPVRPNTPWQTMHSSLLDWESLPARLVPELGIFPGLESHSVELLNVKWSTIVTEVIVWRIYSQFISCRRLQHTPHLALGLPHQIQKIMQSTKDLTPCDTTW